MTSLNANTLKAITYIKEKAQNKRIVFVSGNFNIIHPGHLRLLRFARECGDYLVVGVLDSRSPGAIVAEDLRLEGIESISWVDYGFILHDPPALFIEELKPALVVKGKEHEESCNPEAEALAKVGGKLIFGSGDISFSSLDLMQHEWRELNPSTIKKPQDFLTRHGFDHSGLLDALYRMSQLRVCVIGDTIVDEYITCDPLGMSQEDPTIVVSPVLHERFIGGAAIVAAHARGIGANVHFISVLGVDETAVFAKEALERFEVELHFYSDESRPTTLKQRYRASQKTLLRVNHLRQHAISAELRERMLRDICDILDAGIDLMIFSDFNYGCLPQPLVDDIVAECMKRSIMMVADSQSSSQIGDVSRFMGMTLLTPTEREARLAVRDFESGLVVLSEKLRQKSSAKNIIMTLGAEGSLIHAGTKGEKWLTDRLPAFNTAPKDVAGAGDSFLTCVSMGLAAGADIWQSSYLGSLAAACQVGRLGNIPLTLVELKEEIEN